MKKTIAVLLALALLASLASCGKEPGGETVSATETDAAAPAPTEDPMAAQYAQMNQTAKEILAAASKGRAGENVNFTELIAQGEALLTQYGALPAQDRAKVDVTGVEEALQTLRSLSDKAEAVAVLYVRAFLTLHEGEPLTVTDVGCIKTELRGEARYLFALTCETADGASRSYYARGFVSEAHTVEMFVKDAENMYAEAPADSESDALVNGNVALSAQAVLAAAKA